MVKARELTRLGQHQPAANFILCRQSQHQGHIKPLTQTVAYSNGAEEPKVGGSKKLSNTEKVKIVVREYGTVAIIFHTCISLFSLGSCYLAVSK